MLKVNNNSIFNRLKKSGIDGMARLKTRQKYKKYLTLKEEKYNIISNNDHIIARYFKNHLRISSKSQLPTIRYITTYTHVDLDLLV